jgi:glycosyltransferase involved in cell wall biosynthesis
MIDLAEFDPGQRDTVRSELEVSPEEVLIGWVGRLDPKKRVEDFIEAAAQVVASHPQARFAIVGGPDAFFPEYAEALYQRTQELGLGQRLQFLGDRPDVPRLLSGFDIFTWLSEGEGMPHVISEAGAAGLAVVATPDRGVVQQIRDGESGLFVPHRSPAAVAAALGCLSDDPALRQRLGSALRSHVEREYSAATIVPRWLALWEEVIAAHQYAIPLFCSQANFNGVTAVC